MSMPVNIGHAIDSIAEANDVIAVDLYRAALHQYLKNATFPSGLEAEVEQVIRWAERLLRKTPEQQALSDLGKKPSQKKRS